MKLFLVYRPTVLASVSPNRLLEEHGQEIAWANAFLDAQRIRQLSLRSLRAYAYDLLHFARWFQNQPQSLSEINESTLLDYVRQRAGNNASCHCPPKSWKCFKTTFAWNGP